MKSLLIALMFIAALPDISAAQQNCGRIAYDYCGYWFSLEDDEQSGPLERPEQDPARIVGVGMPITEHPLHRSGRAAFPHPALASGDDAKAAQRVRMTDAGRRQPASDKSPHAVPEDATGLTAPGQRALPELADLKPEPVERGLVHRHPVVPDVPPDHRAQPRAHDRDGVMHASPGVRLSPRLGDNHVN